MKSTTLKVLTVFFLFCQKIGYSQQTAIVNVLNEGVFQIEYGCITQSADFEIDFPALEVTDLVYNWTYGIVTNEYTQPIIREVDYTPFPDYFDEINPNQWTWIHPTITTDTIILECMGYYSDWEIGEDQWFTFRINSPYPYGTSYKNVKVSIIQPDPAIEITGASLSCSNPVSFNLINVPTSYTSTTWEIKQGTTTRASGSGTTASANNLSNGAGEVIFTISFSCGLSNLTYRKEFWFGVPEPTIDGEQYPGCGDMNWYFLEPDDMWGTYSWSVTYRLSIIGSSLGHKAKIRADEEGDATIYCDVTNSCGTDHGSLQVWVGECFDFRMSPNPANEYIDIQIEDTKTDLRKLDEYDINIINDQKITISQQRTSQPLIRLSTKELRPGIYFVQLIYKGRQYVKQLVINH